MEDNSNKIKKEHIESINRLLLIVGNYKKYMTSNIEQWDSHKSRELEILNNQIEELIDGFFSLVNE